MILHDIIRGRLPGGGFRFAFLHPFAQTYVNACRALQIRGRLQWGSNPIGVPGLDYNAWYTDVRVPDLRSYCELLMLVQDFFPADRQGKFHEVFPVDRGSCRPWVNNPANYLKAQQEKIDDLVDRYAKTSAPLTFYDTKFPAEGVALFLDSFNFKDGRRGAINNYEQGMGKTRIGCVSMLEADLERYLVIAPKTARATAWPNELANLGRGDEVTPINRHNWHQSTSRWDLLQWDELRLMPDKFFNAGRYELILCDELHFASNFESQRSQALEALMRYVRWLWGMTGTVIRKRPSNMVNPLTLIRHPLVCSNNQKDDDKVTDFYARYCGTYDRTKQEWDLRKPKVENLPELHALTRDCMIRHEKAETSLPAQVYIPVEVQFGDKQFDAIDKAWDDYLNDPKNKAKMAKPNFPYADVRWGVMQRAAAMQMVPFTIEWAENLIALGHKVIIFTGVTECFKTFMKHFGARAVGVNGSTPDAKRREAEHRFQTDDSVDGFIGNIIAAGVSFTLTIAEYLAFNDLTPITADIEQAGARNNRGGSVREGQNHFFYAPGTQLEGSFKDFVKHLDIIDQVSRVRDKNGKMVRKSVWRPKIQIGAE